MLDTNHQLYKLAESVNWGFLESEIVSILGQDYGAHWRIVTGSIYLKSFYDMSSKELMALWSECQHLRYFCGDEVSSNGSESFPLSRAMLDKLSLKLNGEGYDAMIKALHVQATVYTGNQYKFPSAIH